MGVFDETAAWALVEAIKKEVAADRVIVNTNCLTMVNISADTRYLHAFATIDRIRSKVFFCGEHARDIAPQGASVLY